MILQALNDYYQRRCADPDPANRLPAFGLELKPITFILELDNSGTLRAITDTRQQLGKKPVATSHLVPEGVKKTSGVAANLLWDSAEYVLGQPDPKKLDTARAKGGEAEYLARLHLMRAAFRSQIENLAPAVHDDTGVNAVLSFLKSDSALASVAAMDTSGDIAASNPVLSFRLVNDHELVCQRPAVAANLLGAPVAADTEHGAASDPPSGPSGGEDPPLAARMCLVSGRTLPPARLHTAIKGVWGAQTSGANIVSFNLDAFNSYGKAQGANAPVSAAAAFAYTTALNALLARGSNQRLQVGDASTVFWAQQDDPLEDEFAALFGGDDPHRHTAQVRALFDSIDKGGFDGARGENRFYVLGLAPNAARIAVRFWHACAVKDLALHIKAWFDDLRLDGGPNDPPFHSLFRLLTAVALQGKADNIPPRLAGDLMRSIVAGTPYPMLWLQAAIQRCRAEQQVTYLRAASIKAFLSRQNRSTPNDPRNTRELHAMLDTANPSTAYRLGRLFATLEKIQEEASPGLNATIRERYYGAASSTPVAVFTTLMRLKNHHLSKLDNRGRATRFEQLLAEIIGGIDDFPAHLPLADQGRFAIGYYHQRQDFFTKRDTTAAEPAATTAAASV